MKLCSIFLFLCIIFLFEIFTGSARDFLNLRNGVVRKNYNAISQAPAGRALLSDAEKDPDIALVAALDGTIHLLEVGSMKPLWSFSSGPPIYSSYQAPVNNESGIGNNYFIDCGDDWELYAHSALGKMKLMKSLEEYISSTPQISDDGGIVLGSKKTTAFLVDVKTGAIIHTYGSIPDSPPSTHSSANTTVSDLTTDDPPLYLTRTDYTLTSFVPNSNQVLWNVTVAEIGVAFLCQAISGTLLDSEASEPGPSYKTPLPCQSRALVYRFRNHNAIESLTVPHGLPAQHQDMMLPGPTLDSLPSQPNVQKVLELLPLSNNSREDVKVEYKYGLLAFPANFFLFVNTLLILIAYHYDVVSKIKIKFGSIPSGTSSMIVHSKKKKPRKSGKGVNNNMKEDNENGSSVNSAWLNLNHPNSRGTDGRTVGKLFVSNKEIAKGCNGTIVLEGIYEGRPVAVKRLVRDYNDIAFKEIQNLIVSDRHMNIVRWYGVEHDRDFVYLALERCDCSLNDLIHGKNSNLAFVMEGMNRIRFGSIDFGFRDFELWKSDGHPSPLLLKLMRDIVSGLVHLHELGIVHRDMKPQNVLIICEKSFCAKLSDMGISKRLVGDMSSFSNHATGNGSSGWQAPEQLLHGRQTRAIDLFSLGCVLFFCITGGKHPFGDHLERDINIVRNKVDLFLVEHIPEAVDLFLRLLDSNPDKRPKALEVLPHPLFWSHEMRICFLRDTSDRVELEDREIDSDLFKALENIANMAVGANWSDKMEPSFLNNIGHYRRYKFNSVRDLLRVVRNKLNHYRELPAGIQEIIGPVPEGFDLYFSSRFPKLLIEVYNVMLKYCREEEWFTKYFNASG